MSEVREMSLVKDAGIKGNTRYFRAPTPQGKVFKRQMTLISRAELSEHEAELKESDRGDVKLAPGLVRSNVELSGDLVLGDHVGSELVIVSPDADTDVKARIQVVEFRKPCWKMDSICDGLQSQMERGRQGVIAMVVEGGTIRVGDRVYVA